MKKSITLASFVLIAALTLSIVVDRVKERASHDRFWIDDLSMTDMVAR